MRPGHWHNLPSGCAGTQTLDEYRMDDLGPCTGFNRSGGFSGRNVSHAGAGVVQCGRPMNEPDYERP